LLSRLSGGVGVVTCFQVRPFQCSASGPALLSPTAQALVAEIAVTELKPVSSPRSMRTWTHFVPFQRRISGPCALSPTAQALRGESIATLASRPHPPGSGLGTLDHLLPFQCKVKVWSSLCPPLTCLLEKPTAQALLAELAATALRSPLLTGLATRLHLAPSQCKIRDAFLRVEPTAQAFLVEVTA